MEDIHKISLFNQDIVLKKPFLFIESNHEDIDNNIEEFLPLLPYSQLYELMERENVSLVNYFLNIYLINQNPQQNQFYDWGSYWKEILNSYDIIQKSMRVYVNLLKVQTLHKKFQKSRKDLLNLKGIQKSFDKMQKMRNFQYSQELLEKLNKERADLTPDYELKADEYNSFQNRMTGFELLQKNHKNQIKILKDEQREHYHKTNLITEEIDQLDPLLDTYQAKLDNLDPDENPEDFSRINEKLENLKGQSQKLRNKRNQRMKQSKTIKKQILTLQHEFRDSTKKYRKILPNFQEIEKQYQSIQQKHHSIEKRIQELEADLAKIIVSNHNSEEDNSFTLKSTHFTSISQINRAIDTKQTEIQTMESQLLKIFKTTESSSIDLQFEEKIKKIENNLSTTRTTLSSGFNENFGIEIAFFLQFIQDTLRILSNLLEPIKLQWLISFDEDKQTKSTHPLKMLKEEIFLKNKPISNLQGLNRWEKAYFFFALNCASLSVLKRKIVSFNLSSLPRSLTTEKTFVKAIEMLQNQINNLDLIDMPFFVFFIPLNIYPLTPRVVISDE